MSKLLIISILKVLVVLPSRIRFSNSSIFDLSYDNIYKWVDIYDLDAVLEFVVDKEYILAMMLNIYE